jgi:BirA family biotin operon repressor/biotin-[acetyl-CoA-carboxylase] ligase
VALTASGIDPAARFADVLDVGPFVRHWVFRDSVDSTNAALRALALEGAPTGTVLVADQQTAGRGRHGRVWHSPPAVGLYISILLRPRSTLRELPRWTLAAAVAACLAVRRESGAPVEIKWPNDLLLGGRKLGGVLAEARSAGDRLQDLVVGTGINLAHRAADFPDGLRETSTSLRLAGYRSPPPERLAAAYLRELGGLARRLDGGGWDAVAESWERLAPGAHGQRVRVIRASRDEPGQTGVTAGIDEHGGLRVRVDRGRMVVLGGDASVAPLPTTED